jgi:hypothetical protein
MNPSSLVVAFIGAIAAVVLVAGLLIPSQPDQAPTSTPPIQVAIPEFSRKPCPDCGAFSHTSDPDGYRTCSVCGAYFISKD